MLPRSITPFLFEITSRQKHFIHGSRMKGILQKNMAVSAFSGGEGVARQAGRMRREKYLLCSYILKGIYKCTVMILSDTKTHGNISSSLATAGAYPKEKPNRFFVREPWEKNSAFSKGETRCWGIYSSFFLFCARSLTRLPL